MNQNLWVGQTYLVALAGLVLWSTAACNNPALAAKDGAEERAAVEQRQETKDYVLTVRATPKPLVVDTTGVYAISVKPKGKQVLKVETPFRVALRTSSPQLQLSKDKLTANDFVNPNAATKTVQVRLTAKARGAHEVQGDVSFFLCTNELCQRHQTKVSTPVRGQ